LNSHPRIVLIVTVVQRPDEDHAEAAADAQASPSMPGSFIEQTTLLKRLRLGPSRWVVAVRGDVPAG
jgi:hypothetical protein